MLQIILYLGLLVALTPLLGNYMFKVFTGQPHFMINLLGWFEKLTYKLTGIDQDEEMTWKSYMLGMLFFNIAGMVIVFLIQLFQHCLPLNSENFPGVSWHSALNTSISFMTNTNWQSYAGETTLSYLVQLLALTVQNFLSAATGIAVLLCVIRGITRTNTDQLGNFWIDISRTIIYVLVPLSMLVAIVLAGQGVIQNFKPYETIQTLQGESQTIPMGPVASQIAIKQLGTNGGGFFNTNSAHPFENPTPFSNFLEMLAILLIPAALTYTFGKMVGSSSQGWTIFMTMFILLIIGLCCSLFAEYASDLPSMEGKETRFGITNSVIWSIATSAASNGSVNAMHDSLSPLSGMIALINIMLGEVIFGGVGAGLYGMIVFIILTVFIAGLMVGRSPEYLGKKIETWEIKMAMLAILAPAFIILFFSAWASVSDLGLSGLTNSGPHGLSEILYAYSSVAGNNGSAFAGLNANTPFYNITTGIGMLAGRFGVIIPVLAIAGSLARKKTIPVSAGTFRTDNFLFIMLLIGIILIVGGLTFFPALSLGPVVEHFLMNIGVTF